MNEKLSKITDKFIENFNTARRVYKLDGNYAAISYAAFLLGNETTVTEERLKEAKKLLGTYSTGFINVKNTLAKEVAAAAVADSVDPDYAAKKINEIYSSLRKIANAADFFGVPASIIYKNAAGAGYDDVIERVKSVYNALKKNHPFITSYEDVLACTLMALCGKPVEEVVRDSEECFDIIKKEYLSGNNAQTVACLLSVFEGTPAEKCNKAIEASQVLKKAKISFDDRSISSLAAITMIVKEEDLQSYISDIGEISEKLKSVRGLGNLGVGKKFRNMLSAAIAAVAYSDDKNVNMQGAAVSSVINVMFAQQLIMVVCMASAIGSFSTVMHSPSK